MHNADESTDVAIAPAGRSTFAGLAIYLCVFVATLIAYPIILLAAGQQLLAICVVVVIALLGLIAYRLIRQRGRVSLAIGVIALPLLVAVTLSSVRYLSPMVHRQRSIDRLERAQIGYKSRQPRKMDRWMTNRAGNLVPIWLTNIIGKDCLTELQSIDGQMSDLQSIRFDAIDASNLSSLRLRKWDDGERFDPKLIDWINDNPRMFFSLTIDQYTEADAQMLGRLERPYAVFVRIDEDSGDLASLRMATVVDLSGDQLTRAQLKQLYSLTELTNLRVALRKMPSAAFADLKKLTNITHLTLTGGTIDDASLQGMVDANLRFLSFTNTKLPELKGIRPISPDLSLKTLSLGGVDYQTTRDLVRLFNCESLAFEGSLTEVEAEQLMESGSLIDIRVYDQQRYRRYRSGSDELD